MESRGDAMGYVNRGHWARFDGQRIHDQQLAGVSFGIDHKTKQPAVALRSALMPGYKDELPTDMGGAKAVFSALTRL